MRERIEQTKVVKDIDGSTSRATQVAQTDRTLQGQDVARNIVSYVVGLLLVVLSLRFLLTLLGANPSNSFANAIYSLSYPFVAPFFSLFNYNLHYGVSLFEPYTLVAMAVYALVAWGIIALININRPTE